MIRNQQAWITVRLDASGISGDLHGSTQYLQDEERSVSAHIPLTADELAPLVPLLEDLIKQHEKVLQAETTIAAAGAIQAAVRLGEFPRKGGA